MSRAVAVVGAGWSGLAAAVALVDAGCHVTLIDAAPQVGGRARRLTIELGDRTFDLDNGQHLLIGAYTESLTLARRVGVDVDARFLVQPFALAYPDGFLMQAWRAPAPLHLAGALLQARGLSWRERLAATLWVRRWQGRGWALQEDTAASSLFAGHPPRLVERLWGPLCLAALNVRLEEASARIFLRVLADSLGAAASASHLYVPRADLSTVLPDAAEKTLRAAGADVLLREPVAGIASIENGARWRVALRVRSVEADAVVLAVPPPRAATLLASTALDELAPAVVQLQAIASAPIATVYLRYGAGTRLPRPVYALDEQPARGAYGQWVFDRGQLDAACDGVVSVIVSGRGAHDTLAPEALAAAVTTQIDACFAVGAPLAQAVVTEKRATIVPAPGLVRPPVELPVPGLLLASDSAASPYPSTLEGSIRSGLDAARAATKQPTARVSVA